VCECVSVCECVCVCECMYVCMYVCVYIYKHTHTNTHYKIFFRLSILQRVFLKSELRNHEDSFTVTKLILNILKLTRFNSRIFVKNNIDLILAHIVFVAL
jgi:hypothetical protein